jgi:hypothetical protein
MQVKLSKNGQLTLNQTIRVGALPTTCTNLYRGFGSITCTITGKLQVEIDINERFVKSLTQQF